MTFFCLILIFVCLFHYRMNMFGHVLLLAIKYSSSEMKLSKFPCNCSDFHFFLVFLTNLTRSFTFETTAEQLRTPIVQLN